MSGYQFAGPRYGGLYLPGIVGNYASTPDENALDIVGDIDVRIRVSMRRWTGTAAQTLLAKYGGSGSRSYRLDVAGNGRLQFIWSVDGTAVSFFGADAERDMTGYPLDTPMWIRATLDVDNGASGRTGRVFTSTDGVTWTQIGSDSTAAGVTSIFSSTQLLEVGSTFAGASQPLAATVYAMELRDGIDGTVVAKPDFTAPVNPWGTVSGATRHDGHRTWTLNGDVWEWR